VDFAPKSSSDQAPPLWPNAYIIYARAQLFTEFPSADPARVFAAVDEATRTVALSEGSVQFARRARELLQTTPEGK
jgi:hypothetical protein